MINILRSIATPMLFVLGGLSLEALGVEHNAYFAFYGVIFTVIYFVTLVGTKPVTQE